MAEKDGPATRPQGMKHGYLWIGLAGVLCALMCFFYWAYPSLRIGPGQPIAFSHRVHAGVKQIDCRFCHPYVARSQDAGLPAVEKCFFCHNYIIPGHPEILKERAYFDAKKPVPWVRVFWVPEFVFFRHEPHIAQAGLDCSRCHGAVKEMDRLGRVNFEMGFCITCHRSMGAELDCWLGCHR